MRSGRVRALSVALTATGLALVTLAVLRGLEPRRLPPSAPAQAAGRFDADSAWRLIAEQVALGPRPANSLPLSRLAGRLARLLPHGRIAPVGRRSGLRNVVGDLPGRSPALLIGAHYDTLASPAEAVGANNGAAGTAIVVQVARALAAMHRPRGAPEVRFVLFDGEEPPHGLPEQSRDFYDAGLRGSRAYAAAHGAGIGAVVVLDYVANRGLRLPREASSDRGLWRQLRASARRVGATASFPDETEVQVIDDHTPFLRRGIPAVDLIDWRYPGHSTSDTLAQLSPLSVRAVGDTILDFASRYRGGSGHTALTSSR